MEQSFKEDAALDILCRPGLENEGMVGRFDIYQLINILRGKTAKRMQSSIAVGRTKI